VQFGWEFLNLIVRLAVYWPLILACVLVLAKPIVLLVKRLVVLPIRIHRRQFLAPPQRQPVLAEDLTPQMSQFIAAMIGHLRSLGFETVLNTLQKGLIPDATAASIQILMIHRQNNDLALILIISGHDGRGDAVNISSRFSDGSRIVTGASRNVSDFPPDPSTQWQTFTWVRDADTLYEAHRRRLQQAGKLASPRVAPPAGGEAEHLNAEWERMIQRSVNARHMYFDLDSGKYWRTWKNCFLLAWRSTPRVKQRRLRTYDRNARQLWNELGMDDWKPPRNTDAIASLPISAAFPEIDQASMPAGSTLRYQAALREGEIHREQLNGALILRMGGPTVGQFMLRNILSLVLAGYASTWFITGLLGAALLVMSKTWPIPAALQIYLLLIPFLGIFLIRYVLRLVRGIRQSRGMMVVHASPAGLQFFNAPGKRRNGRIARDDIQILALVAERPFLRVKRFRLEIVPFGAAERAPILVGRNAIALAGAKKELLQAMGMALQQPSAVE
jgi:hypothetical protein